jgi:hypothetical protein
MVRIDPDFLEHQRKRWMRSDWHRYVRPDAYRWVRPGHEHLLPPEYRERYGARPGERTGNVVRASIWRRSEPPTETSAGDDPRPFEADDDARPFEAQVRELRCELAALRFRLALKRLIDHCAKANFNPSQPRVPAGHPDGGQWTRVHLASGGGLPVGPRTLFAIAAELAMRAIGTYRSENGLYDLFGYKVGTVAVTTIDGENIFGSNSTSPAYTLRDLAAAKDIRSTLMTKYPDIMDSPNSGRRPYDALFHAETTILLRAARARGGTLAGQSIEVHIDRELCPSCEKMLPLVGLELGNPSVTFVESSGLRRSMRDGLWIEGASQ